MYILYLATCDTGTILHTGTVFRPERTQSMYVCMNAHVCAYIHTYIYK